MGWKEKERLSLSPNHHTLASWDRIKTRLSWNPPTAGDRRPHSTPGRNRGRRKRWRSERGWQRWRQSQHIDGWSDDFLHTLTQMPPPTILILLPPSGPGPAGKTHASYTSHTHTHAMVRPPIKSKVVCFYWSFALTSGLSFWRLYLSASSWKFSVDNAQCFQLGENQAPGALAIFPPPPPPEPTFLPSLFFLRTGSAILRHSLAFHSPPSCRRRRSVSAANYPHKTKVVAALALGAAGPGPCQH